MFVPPACFLNRCYLHLSTITSFFSQIMSVEWRPEGFPHVARDFPKKSLNFSKNCPKVPQRKSKVSFCGETCSKVVYKNCTVVCADCLLPLVAVTEVIMASSNINKLSMMISSISSRDQICQKLLSCLWKKGWYTLAWYFQELRTPPHLHKHRSLLLSFHRNHSARFVVRKYLLNLNKTKLK